jgi:hypothetical protein
VVRQAQALHASKGSDVTGIDHAIGSLGMERLGKLAKECKALRLHAHRTAELQYFRAIANSHHTATHQSGMYRNAGPACAGTVDRHGRNTHTFLV